MLQFVVVAGLALGVFCALVVVACLFVIALEESGRGSE